MKRGKYRIIGDGHNYLSISCDATGGDVGYVNFRMRPRETYDGERVRIFLGWVQGLGNFWLTENGRVV